MRYLLGSGFFANEPSLAFHRDWVKNVLPATQKASRRVIISVGTTATTWKADDNAYDDFDYIHLSGNLGHVGQLINGTKPYNFGGWAAAVMALAMIAYNDESDFVYFEQDVLAFGPWLDQMYKDMGDANMVFGGPMKSSPFMEAAQGLFLIRHHFIPDFIWRYLSLGRDKDMLPETKFARMASKEWHHFRHLSFGVDRERPLPWAAPIWYAQHWTKAELDEARKRGLI